MRVDEKLRAETLKWLEKISQIRFSGDREFVENINAYINDSKYFLENSDLIRAFECVVWAWAWLEIGRNYGFLEVIE